MAKKETNQSNTELLKSSVKWTKDQQQAIDSRNHEVLVSAAAGSGKTAVLVERVYQMIESGMDIERMLIVTFTRAAAAEMREKIIDKMRKMEKSRHELHKVMTAQISTIHVFCLHLIREYAHHLGLDPQVQVGQDALLDNLLQRATDDAIEEMYVSPTDEMKNLSERFEDEDIAELAEQLRRYALSLDDPEKWLNAQGKQIKGDFAKSEAYKILLKHAQHRLFCAEIHLNQMEKLLDANLPEICEAIVRSDADTFELLIGDMENGSYVRPLHATQFMRLNLPRNKDAYDQDAITAFQKARKQFKDEISKALDKLPREDEDNPGQLKQAAKYVNDAAVAVRGLCRLVLNIESKFTELKRRYNVVDYHDLEHEAYRALRDFPDVREKVSGAFDAIFVDEYQDVSGIQEAIVRALLNENNSLFMVGDIKQSIYRFRLADPSLFREKYEKYTDSESQTIKKRKIILQQNFRSDKNILDAVNLVFASAMHADLTEIEYDEKAKLNPGTNAEDGPSVTLNIVVQGEPDDENDDNNDEIDEVEDDDENDKNELKRGPRAEAVLMAEDIKRLRGSLVIKEKDGFHMADFRDFCILLRKKQHAAIIAEEMNKQGIPVYSDADSEYYSLPEVDDVLNILRLLENPYQDVPLLSALRTPAFHFSNLELAKIRLLMERDEEGERTAFSRAFIAYADKDDEIAQHVREAQHVLSDWRFLSKHFPPEKTVWHVMVNSGVYMLCGAMKDADARQGNLRLLAENAAQYETVGDLLQNVAHALKDSDDGKTAKTLGEKEQVVRIMTMHKSKGLQFPVVLLPELAKQLRGGSNKKIKLRVDQKLGIGLPAIYPEINAKYGTALEKVLDVLNDDATVAEEIRLLYVAMTRAEHKLILYGSPANLDHCMEKWMNMTDPIGILNARTMLDIVCAPLHQVFAEDAGQIRPRAYTAPNGSRWDIFYPNIDKLNLEKQDEQFAVPRFGEGEVPARLRKLYEEELPKPDPMKTSVTAIAKHFRQLEDTVESPETKRVSRETIKASPAYEMNDPLRRLTGAEKGTIIHKALGLMNLSNLRGAGVDEIARRLDEMQRKGQLSKVERQNILPGKLYSFYASPIGLRMFASPEVHREWAFNLQANERTMLQGVLDLCFIENDQWVLVDYKTDRVDDAEELVPRYGEQIRWYASALQRLTGRPVREMLLYSIQTGKTAAVKPGSVSVIAANDGVGSDEIRIVKSDAVPDDDEESAVQTDFFGDWLISTDNPFDEEITAPQERNPFDDG